jgi:hypothetical protein
VRYNGEWLAGLDFAEILRLTRTTTVSQILERDDFAKRYAGSRPISVSELLYPLMQAYDSVAIEADVELGGTDQLYNLLAGRTVMEAYGLAPQVVLTTPLLLSWDGAKMSSSVGNNIPLTAAPEEQFGRTMRIPDEQLPEWWRLIVERDVPAGDPLDAKLELARFVVRRSHGGEAAAAAEAHFTRVVREGGARGGPRARAAGRRPGAPACPDRDGLRALDERRAADDRSGWRQARGCRGTRPRPCPLLARRSVAAGREAPLRPYRRRFLTPRGPLLDSLGRPRGRQGKSCNRPGAPSLRTGYDLFVARRTEGLWRERRPFRCPPDGTDP